MGDVDAHIQIYERYDDGECWWLQITGELFGPFDSDEEAIDAIPNALRSTF
jgi:hypothetical protein